MIDERDPPRLRDGDGDLAELLRRGHADLPGPAEMKVFAERLPLAAPPATSWLRVGAIAASGTVAISVLIGFLARGPGPGPSVVPALLPIVPQPASDASTTPEAPPAPSPASARGDASAPPAQRATAPAPGRAPMATSVSPPPSAPAPDPALELQMLDRARRKVASAPDEALSLATEHARLFPRSAFGQEREVIVIEALARSGRKAEAAARARRFLDASPSSAYRDRLAPIAGPETP